MSASGSNQGLRAGVCLSTTRPAAPYDGQMIYETDTNLVRIWNGTAWKTLSYSDYTSGSVIQVASASRSTLFTSSSTTYTDVTNVSVAITPTSTSSKILVSFSTAGVGANGTADVLGRLMRDSTSICETAFVACVISASNQSFPASFVYLDSPASTSALTYKLQARTTNSAFSIGGRYDGNYTGVSSIIVMEIAG